MANSAPERAGACWASITGLASHRVMRCEFRLFKSILLGDIHPGTAPAERMSALWLCALQRASFVGMRLACICCVAVGENADAALDRGAADGKLASRTSPTPALDTPLYSPPEPPPQLRAPSKMINDFIFAPISSSLHPATEITSREHRKGSSRWQSAGRARATSA